MAIYVSVARRRRHAIALAAATLLVGLVAGLLVGRHGAPSVTSRVRSVRSRIAAVAARLENVPNEYAKAISGRQSLQSGVLDTIDALRRDTQASLDRAPWVRQTQRDSVLDAFAKTRSDAAAKVDAPTFATDVNDITSQLKGI